MEIPPLSFQIIPNLIFILSILGIFVIVLRHLPDAAVESEESNTNIQPHTRLLAKGLPAQAISKIRVSATFTVKKFWFFILEAKDLRPHSAAGYKIKKMFTSRLTKPKALPVPLQQLVNPKNEQFYLDQIKIEPKNLKLYDDLGKYYLEQENLNDARDIYHYLVNHEPANPDFHARLGFCFFKSQNYEKAAQAYGKAIALDSTQPNRYYNLGLSQEAAGELDDAERAFKKALELEPQNPKYLYSLEKLANSRLTIHD